MSGIVNYFDSDFSHLLNSAENVRKPRFSGVWCTIEIQPDAFVPQRFTVGVVVQAVGGRLHFKLLSDYRKFECIYRNDFSQKSIQEVVAHAEEVLRHGVQRKEKIENIDFGMPCISLSVPQYTSGEDEEETVERLFDDVVVMNVSVAQGKKGFESIDTSQARRLVNEELKRIAGLDYELIVCPGDSGVFVDEGGRRHLLDINLLTRGACGSVASAVYKASQSVELSLLKSSRDLTTYSRVKRVGRVGIFLLMPDRETVDSKEYGRIESVISQYEWKLEQDGFRVVSLSSPSDLALEIYGWAKPTL